MFRIKERKYSSNIIEIGEELTKSNGEVQISWKPYWAPLCTKKEGDIICKKFIESEGYSI